MMSPRSTPPPDDTFQNLGAALFVLAVLSLGFVSGVPW